MTTFGPFGSSPTLFGSSAGSGCAPAGITQHVIRSRSDGRRATARDWIVGGTDRQRSTGGGDEATLRFRRRRGTAGVRAVSSGAGPCLSSGAWESRPSPRIRPTSQRTPTRSSSWRSRRRGGERPRLGESPGARARRPARGGESPPPDGSELAEAVLSDVTFADCRLGLVGLRAAKLERIVFATAESPSATSTRHRSPTCSSSAASCGRRCSAPHD